MLNLKLKTKERILEEGISNSGSSLPISNIMLKKNAVLLFSVILSILFLPQTLSAQIIGGQCRSITTESEYNICCNENYATNASKCDAYRQGTFSGQSSSSGSTTQQGAGTTATPAQCTNVTTQDQWVSCCGVDFAKNQNACEAYRQTTFGGPSSSAGAGTQQGANSQCLPVTNDNYSSCCDANYSNNYNACDAYRQATFSGTGLAGTGRDIPLNGSVSVVAGSATSPQSSATDLTTCSAIKFKSLLDILIWVRCIITAAVIPLIFSLAFLFFLWGVFKFMYATDLKDKEESKKFILWGLIALFIMVSVWGIIKLLQTTFGFKAGVPYLQTQYLDTNNANKTP